MLNYFQGQWQFWGTAIREVLPSSARNKDSFPWHRRNRLWKEIHKAWKVPTLHLTVTLLLERGYDRWKKQNAPPAQTGTCWYLVLLTLALNVHLIVNWLLLHPGMNSASIYISASLHVCLPELKIFMVAITVIFLDGPWAKVLCVIVYSHSIAYSI